MTKIEDERVIAMKTDANNEVLLAGDTAGFIAIFCIQNYCTSDEVQLWLTNLDPKTPKRNARTERVLTI